MMVTIQVSPVTPSDFETMARHSSKGDLVAPALEICCPVPPGSSTERLHWSLAQQKLYLSDPTCHLVKAIDTQSGEIIAIARWHHYTSERQEKSWEFAGEKDEDVVENYPAGTNVGLLRKCLGDIIDDRMEWMIDGEKWVLSTLKTRDGFRRLGAGEALVRWGKEQAKKDEVPTYLEAAAGAVSLYEKCGFKDVKDLVLDYSEFGIPQPMVFKQMAWNFGIWVD